MGEEKRDRVVRLTRQAHDLKTGGSIPSSAIKNDLRQHKSGA